MRMYTILFFLALVGPLVGQVYIDNFDDGMEFNVVLGNGYSSSEADGEWTITGDGTTGAFEVFTLTPNNPDGSPLTIDISDNNKVFVRAKASNLGTQLRLDVRDADGNASTLAGLTRTLISDYTTFEFDFTGVLNDGGFGGTGCDAADAPCPVDPTMITEFNFYVNPGQGAFAGAVVMDFISVGVAPDETPVSDIWQDHFDDEVALGYMGSAGPGLTNSVANSNWIITGDGTGDLFAPVNMLFYNPTTLDTIDVPVSQGNDKVFIRMRTSTAGTTVRLDLQDINDMATTGASITKPITDEWTTYEYNFAGGYSDLGFGGTGCSSDQAPCPVDAERIANMIIFINPGAGAFVGEVEIDYISIGKALEVNANPDGVLVYGDHFSTDASYVGTTGAFSLSVDDSNLKITGEGQATPFSAIAYSVHDMETGEGSVVDATGNNKVFIRAKSDAPNTLLRVDLVDSTGLTTSQASITRLVSDEFTILELDFLGQYFDGGFGGTPCDGADAPCPVDPTAISTVLLYPNAVDGGFDGCLEIDFISFGAPMGEDVQQYVDEFDNDNRDQWSDASGFTVAEADGELVIAGDGTSGAFTSFNYTLHNTEDFTPLTVDVTSNNKVYVRAKSTLAGVPLRIDLVDEGGFATTEPATAVMVGTDYQVLEFDFTDTYTDGGYGGTACNMGPCPVDGSTVQNMLVYIDASNGGYNDTLTIDWISTLRPLEDDPVDAGPVGIDDYADEMNDNSLDFISDNGGLATVAEDGQLKVIGDGTSGAFAPILYQLHDGADSVRVNGEANDNKVFIRARSTVDGLPLRIDVQDNLGFLTSLAGLTQSLTTDFEVYEFDFTGNYSDGGFGGSPCTAGPCPVDAQRLEQMQIYLAPGVGMFSGELHIDWISFGTPLTSVDVVDHTVLQGAKVYPNPADDAVTLELNVEVESRGLLSIMDISGATVRTIDLGSIQAGPYLNRLDIADLNTGFYLLHLQMDKQPAFTSKLIVR